MKALDSRYYDEAVELHRESVVVLTHCDTILHLLPGPYVPKDKVRKLGVKSDFGHVDLPRLSEAHVNCVFFAVYVESVFKPERALRRALELMERFYSEVEESSDKVKLVKSFNDLKNGLQENKLCAVLSLEGAEPVQDSLLLLRMFKRLGIMSMSLTWSERNMLADGCWEQRTKGGLSNRGVRYVEEAENLGMILDVSHLSDVGFWDLIEVAKKPVIASHSNCRALCDTPRNLTDEQLRALAEKNGVIGVNFAPSFLTKSKEATLDDVVRHINHIVEIAGIDHVGLGTDYDGIWKTPIGLEDVSKLPNLTAKLIEQGYSDKELRKILGENFVRVMRTCWEV